MAPLLPPLGRFALGLTTALLLGWLCIRYLSPRGFMDVPSGRKQHEEPVPRTGGIAWVLAMLVALGLGWVRLPFDAVQWVAVILMGIIGVVDDRYCLRARWKAIVGLAVAVMLAYVGAKSLLAQKLELDILGIPLAHSPGVYFTLLTLFYWCVPQSFNLIDGLNGLALGFALLVLSGLALSGHAHPATAGTVAGILALNWPRAKHFMGDAGSMGLGILLAMVVKKSYAPIDPNLVLCVFAYPFLDTTMVVVIRLCKGLSPAHADRSHMHHLLHDRVGLPNRWVTPLLLLEAAATISAVGAHGWGWTAPIAGATALGAQAIGFAFLEIRAHRAERRLVLTPSRGSRRAQDFLAG